MKLELLTRAAAVLVLCGYHAEAARIKSKKTASVVKALPPGFEDELYCPKDYCIHDKAQMQGMTGPRRMFYDCKHVLGESEDLAVQTWGFRQPAEDKERLAKEEYHQTHCPEGFEGKTEVTADSEDYSAYECGAIVKMSNACFPKKRDWWGSWFDKEACTGQCTHKHGLFCSCPNAGEACTSARSNDPGLQSVNGKVDYTFVSANYAVKVNKETREWEYLASKQEWDGAEQATIFYWKSPSAVGKSFMASSVITPTPADIIIQDFNSKADFCNPRVAAQYMKSFGALGAMYSLEETDSEAAVSAIASQLAKGPQ